MISVSKKLSVIAAAGLVLVLLCAGCGNYSVRIANEDVDIRTTDLSLYCKELSAKDIDIETLVLEGTEVADLTPLAGLTALKELNLYNCYMVEDLSPLKGLTNLERLNISNTGAPDISPLSDMKKLTYLNMAPMEVKELSPLAGLHALDSLYISSPEAPSIPDRSAICLLLAPVTAII